LAGAPQGLEQFDPSETGVGCWPSRLLQLQSYWCPRRDHPNDVYRMETMFTRKKSDDSATGVQHHFVPISAAFVLPEGKPMLDW
jgi:hypothetical protein